jgi:hypothetical protein
MCPQTCVDIWNSAVGCAKPSHTQILQRFQSKLLRTYANAPWYVSNLQLPTELGISFVKAEIPRSSLLYHRRLAGHPNVLVAALSTPPNVPRRLKHRWPSDLHSVTSD